MIFWLKNRRPQEWRDKREIEHSGAIDFNNATDEELARIAGIGRAGASVAETGAKKPH
jgi:DNA uptake protein ComE-like DNA-binding protein